MTVEVSGLSAAQARVGEIQARFGMLPAPGTANGSTASTQPGTQFRTTLADAIAKNNAAPATADRPFVYDPSLSPLDAPALKTGAAAALAAPPPAPPAAPAVDTAATAAASLSGVAGAAATSAVSATSPVAAAANVSGLSGADALIATAKKYLGVPYKWGGTNPAVGLDCSGFLQLVFKQHGFSLPRVADDQRRSGRPVASMADARPGDIVAFGNPATHIGIYVGNGKMIHAPRTGDVVKISDVYRTPSFIRRILPEESAQRVGPGAQQSVGTRVGADAARAIASAAAADPLAAAPVVNALAANVPSATNAVGGWAGAPAPDTWGAASAAAASGGIAALLDPPASPAASNASTSAAGLAALGASTVGGAAGVLAQAPAAYQSLFRAAETKYGVPAQLLAAVAKQESNFTPTAVSHAGARGLMQLMPGTARALGVSNSFDPAQAVDGAARLLRDHLKTFRSTELALAAYNAGPGAVRRYNGIPPYNETQNYVRKIMRNLNGVVV